MTFARIAATVSICLASAGCSAAPGLMSGPFQDAPLMKLRLLSGDAALEPAYVRFVLVDKTDRSKYRAQALPASWVSAIVRLHSTDATAKLTQDRVATIDKASGFTGGTANAAVFTNLRPGSYVFQVTLMTAAGGTGTSAAVHTTNLTLAGGSSTAITVTMKTTDGTDNTNGGTVLNTTVSDTTGFVRSNGTNYNSVLGGPASTPVIVAGDTLLLDPQLSDSTAAGSASVTAGGSTIANVAALDPGVLSRVLVTYANNTVTPTGPNLLAGETILTDWVRSGNEPIRGTSWASLADSTDGGTWPARGAATRTGSGTFSGTFNWNTTTGLFTSPAPFTNESSLSENYRLIYRYYDNTYTHNLIKVRILPMAVVSPASINLTVQ